jgi:P-type conjugative transfer protein TrbJ
VRIAAVAASALLAGPAAAQVAVFDPTNYAQNVLQAARALEQVQHQLESLQNEAAMLAGQARNLAPLDLHVAGALNADLARVNGLLTQAGRLASQVDALQDQFEREYGPPEGVGDGLPAAADARWRNSMEALRRTLQVQAAVTGGLSATTAQAAALASRSEGAEGALQAAQAGNQLLAVQSKQLADLTALLAAQGQAQALEAARAASTASDAKARLARFLGKAAP